jgi:hypothetical protein
LWVVECAGRRTISAAERIKENNRYGRREQL